MRYLPIMASVGAHETSKLESHSIAEYSQDDLRRVGTRGVSGYLGMQARVRAFDPVTIVSASGAGSEVERRLSRPGEPTIDIVFIESGEFEYYVGGTWRHNTAALLIAPTGSPRRVRFLGPWSFIIARIPRAALLEYVPVVDDDVYVYPTLTLPERAMSGFLMQMVESDDPVSETGSVSIARLLVKMAGNLLLERQNGEVLQGSPRAVSLDKAMAFIAVESEAPELTPVHVAAAVNVSLRQLQAIFAEVGTSIAQEIRRARARNARSMLQNPSCDKWTVEQVSELSGFATVRNMRRALLEIYCLTAKELRDTRP